MSDQTENLSKAIVYFDAAIDEMLRARRYGWVSDAVKIRNAIVNNMGVAAPAPQKPGELLTAKSKEGE